MARAARQSKSSRGNYRMVEAISSVSQHRLNIFQLEVWQLLENLRVSQSGREQVEDINHADSHPANARAAAALLGVDGDAFSIHNRCTV